MRTLLLRTWYRRAAAVLAAAVVAASLGSIAAARAAGEQPVSVAVQPCRLFDTRPGADNVGAKSTPLSGGSANVMTVQVTGSSGRCNLPVEATSVRLNLTVVSPTATSFLTVYPSGKEVPATSALNWTAGQAPRSNFAETTLSSRGAIDLFTPVGTVHVLADVTGYTVGHSPAQLDQNELARGRWENDPGRDLATALTTDGEPVFDGQRLWVPKNSVVTGSGGQTDLLRLLRFDRAAGSPSDVTVTLRSAARSTSLVSVVDDTLFDGTSIWVAYHQQSTTSPSSVSEPRLAKVDPVTARLVTTVTLPARPRALAFDGSRVWVASDLLTTVVRVDAATAAVLSPDLSVGADVSDLLFDGSKMWMTGTRSAPLGGLGSGSVTVATTFTVDPTTGTTGTVSNGGVAANLGLGFDGSRVWVWNFSNTITLIQASTGASAGSVILPGSGTVQDLEFDGTAMWASRSAPFGGATTSLTVVNVSTLSSTTSATGSGAGPNLAFDGAAVWSSSPLARHRLG